MAENKIRIMCFVIGNFALDPFGLKWVQSLIEQHYERINERTSERKKLSAILHADFGLALFLG